MNFQDVITQVQDNVFMQVIATILIGLVGFMSAAMANTRIAVFNDGVRPLIGEANAGRMNHKVLSGISIAMGIGYVIGFLPLSIAAGFLVVHIILLGGDMIGLAFPFGIKPEQKKTTGNKFVNTITNNRWMFISGLAGLGFAIAMFWGLQGIDWLFTTLAYPGFSWDLGSINAPFAAVFALFPAVAIGLQHGYKKGGIAMLVTLFTYGLFAALYSINWSEPTIKNIFQEPGAWALLAGVIMLLVFAFGKGKTKNAEQKTMTNSSVFTQNAALIANKRWWFVLSGSLIGMTVTSLGFVESPSSAPLYANGDLISALLVEGTRVIGFIPLVVLTALASGSYSPDGVKFSMFSGTIGAIVGSVIVQQTGIIYMYLFGLLVSGLLAGASLYLETTMIKKIAIWLDRYEGVKDAGGHIRTSITRILNLLLIISSSIAAYTIGNSVTAINGFQYLGYFGIAIVVAAAMMNKFIKKPLPEMAVGPTALLVVGVLFNVIRFIPFG